MGAARGGPRRRVGHHVVCGGGLVSCYSAVALASGQEPTEPNWTPPVAQWRRRQSRFPRAGAQTAGAQLAAAVRVFHATINPRREAIRPQAIPPVYTVARCKIWYRSRALAPQWGSAAQLMRRGSGPCPRNLGPGAGCSAPSTHGLSHALPSHKSTDHNCGSRWPHHAPGPQRENLDPICMGKQKNRLTAIQPLVDLVHLFFNPRSQGAPAHAESNGSGPDGWRRLWRPLRAFEVGRPTL